MLLQYLLYPTDHKPKPKSELNPIKMFTPRPSWLKELTKRFIFKGIVHKILY